MFTIRRMSHRIETHGRTIVLQPTKPHKYSIVWLHGLGDSAEGFSDLFTDTEISLVPANCRVILPTAPERAVSCNHGMKMNAWFDI